MYARFVAFGENHITDPEASTSSTKQNLKVISLRKTVYGGDPRIQSLDEALGYTLQLFFIYPQSE